MQNGAIRFQHSTKFYNYLNINKLGVEGIRFIKCFQHTFNSFQQNIPSTAFNMLKRSDSTN